MLEAAFLITYWFRFHTGIWLVPLGIPAFSLYLWTSFLVLLVFFSIFYTQGLYSRRGWRRLEEDLFALGKGVALGSLLLLALAFFLKRETYSRSFFGLFVLSSGFFLSFGRLLVRWLLRLVLQRGRGRMRLLLVGMSPMRERILRLARELPGLAFEPVGWLACAADTASVSEIDTLPTAGASAARPAAADATPDGSDALPCLGDLAEVRRVVRQHRIDRVILTLPFAQLPLVSATAEQLANLTVDLQFVPDLMALHTSKMRLQEIAGIPFISVRETAISGADRIVKRTFDLFLAAAGLLLLSPLLAVLGLLVKLSSPGPMLYRQVRMGRDGREFTMFKFRSMRVDAEAVTGPVRTVAGDSRVTAIGGFLRRFSLDELPQLWNVVQGDMSLVGPRPERKVFVDRFREQMPRYFERHQVKSGITGWAQVHGLRGNTSVEERTLYDLHYVENWSLGLDIRILLMTVHHVLRGVNAY